MSRASHKFRVSVSTKGTSRIPPSANNAAHLSCDLCQQGVRLLCGFSSIARATLASRSLVARRIDPEFEKARLVDGAEDFS